MKIGDKVTWTHCSTRGRAVSMRLREGVIKALGGDVAHVRRPGGRCESVAVSRLRLPSQKSQITEFVEFALGRDLP